MIRFVVKRLFLFIPVLWAIITITFFLVRMAPGGPFDEERSWAPEVLEQIRARYNLDEPLHVQYADYLGGILRGDLGPSLHDPSRSVSEWIALRFPVSLELGLYGLAFALLIGLGAGIVAAVRPNTWSDQAPMALSMAGICIPNFVLGPVLVLVFAVWAGWLPVYGWAGPAHKILPAITLGAVYAAYIARLTRAGMLEVLSEDFIRTARAKGLGPAAVVLRHGLRGGLRPVVAYLGPAAANILTGSFVVETIFEVPGLGRKFVESALDRDYTMVMGTVIFFAGLIMLFNLLVDVVQAWMDPRLRHA
jgi:oligopeptide transport system permease protein